MERPMFPPCFTFLHSGYQVSNILPTEVYVQHIGEAFNKMQPDEHFRKKNKKQQNFYLTWFEQSP